MSKNLKRQVAVTGYPRSTSADDSQRASYEYDRFHRTMCEPSFALADIDKDTLYFWVEEESDDIDVVTLQVMMENLLDV